MSFRKRNIGLSGPTSQTPKSDSPSASNIPERSTHDATPLAQASGVRPSPLDGRPTTSTGTQTLDSLLTGHAGLALGNLILVEESGTTDFAGTLLRYYAAEGVVQGHRVHVVGVGEPWGRELPGLVPGAGIDAEDEVKVGVDREKMKIAWRYENLGDFDARASNIRALTTPNRNHKASDPGERGSISPAVFCHTFDLTKRLTLPDPTAINFIPIRPVNSQMSPFTTVIQNLTQQLSSSPTGTVHRIIIPMILSPALYPPHASNPQCIIQFLHSLRSLLRQYPTQVTAMLTLPLTLYARSTGLIRWAEILSDGVLELAPFPHIVDAGPSSTSSSATTVQEEKPQGIVKVHRLPVFHERGGGGAGNGGVGDLAFTVSRRKFVIKPFSLPPVEGDTEAQRGEVEGKATKVNIEF
ncbi:hypothetical protein MMC12_005680 [Toensbergia leucococca]|nr:hypothetical protein [Toensbergia leucococca]